MATGIAGRVVRGEWVGGRHLTRFSVLRPDGSRGVVTVLDSPVGLVYGQEVELVAGECGWAIKDPAPPC